MADLDKILFLGPKYWLSCYSLYEASGIVDLTAYSQSLLL